MKKSNFIILITSFAFFSCGNNNNDTQISLVSDETILPDSSFVFWGDTMNDDMIVFSDYKYLPKLKNISGTKVDTLIVQATIHGLRDTSEVSRYYIIDDVSREKETNNYNVIAHYGKFTLNPFEVIPFPITSIEARNANRPFIVSFDFYWNVKNGKGKMWKRTIVGVVYHNKPIDDKTPLQKSFILLSRSLLNWQDLQQNTFIYKDTIIPLVRRYDILRNKELSINEISELQ